jgi:antitoxin component of MazEF toxin-antitoxin module
MAEKKPLRFHTTVGLTRPGSPSLRTTIPDGVVQAIELTDGDGLDWFVKSEGESFIVNVKRGPKK